MNRLRHATLSIGLLCGSALMGREALESSIEDYATPGETRTLETAVYFIGGTALLAASFREGLCYNDLRIESVHQHENDAMQESIGQGERT